MLFQRPALPILLAAMALAVLAYWTGLSGPFLFDDQNTMPVLQDWLEGRARLHHVLFGNQSGQLGRPVSMASMALSAWLGGYSTFSFKFGNLIVHLLCGLAAYLFLSTLLRRDRLLAPRAPLYAALVCALWLLHPLNVSTVLYAVQRMAQMGTLFVLLGLWLYVAVRGRLTDGKPAGALPALFLGFPVLLALGVLSKENALVLPALCLVVELAWFGSWRQAPRVIKTFFGLFAALPALLAVVAIALKPQLVTATYDMRPFSMGERVLTQARVLCDYLFSIALPRSPRMGIYTDDFAISTGLLSPPTTLIAILVLAAISALALWQRKRLPFLFAGWFFFLIAHGIESSVLALDLYYEHRNYLPMFGILLALMGLAIAAGTAMRSENFRPGRVGVLLSVALIALLAFQTHGRARVWKYEDTIAEMAVRTHPRSQRAIEAAMIMAMRRGDIDTASRLIQSMIDAPDPRLRAQGFVHRVTLDCVVHQRANPEDLDQAARLMPAKLTLPEAYTFYSLLRNEQNGGCGPVTPGMIADAIVRIVDKAKDQPVTSFPKWRLRHIAALFYGRQGDWPAALTQARLAWQPNSDPAAGQILLQAQLDAGDHTGALRTYEEIAARSNPDKWQDARGMAQLRETLSQAGLDVPGG